MWKRVASKFVRRISILFIRQRSEKFRTRFSQHFFDVQVYRCHGEGQVHLGNAFPVRPTALRPFLLKLRRSVPRFGKTEFQRKVFVGVAVNAQLLRFLRTRDSYRWTWRLYSSYVTICDTETICFQRLHDLAVYIYYNKCHITYNM